MLKLVSLFSGIGAYERALQNLGVEFETQHYCEILPNKSKAYSILHNVSEEKNLKDVTNITEQLEETDVLVYSPPCQSFSIAGKHKGTTDHRGTLFWHALEVIKQTKPKVAVMENVFTLPTKFKETFDTMLKDLSDAGYTNYYKIIDAKDFIPQHRERVYIVSIRNDISTTFEFPTGSCTKNWWDILDMKDTREITKRQQRMLDYALGFNTVDEIKIEGKVSTDKAIIQLRQSGLRFSNSGVIPTLCAAMGKGGGNFPMIAIDGLCRGVSAKQAFMLMGFKREDAEKLEVSGISQSDLYVMAGDSVVVTVLEAIFSNIIKSFEVTYYANMFIAHDIKHSVA